MVFTAARHSILFMPRESCPQPHNPLLENHLILSSQVSLDILSDAALIFPEYNNGYISIPSRFVLSDSACEERQMSLLIMAQQNSNERSRCTSTSAVTSEFISGGM